VSIGLIKLERKNTTPRSIKSFKRVKKRARIISDTIGIDCARSTQRNTKLCITKRSPITAENQKNFPKIKSLRAIGLESIKKIVFPSTSLKSS